MESNTEDRRIRRTKRLLEQGLTELLKVKDFKEISVKDITDHMDMNRGTFYLHYTDTYDLLHALESSTISDVQKMIDKYRLKDSDNLQQIFEPLLLYIVENRDICYSLFANNASSGFIKKIHDLIYQNGSALMHRRFSNVPDNKLEYVFSFITFGVIGLIKQWFETDMVLPSHDIVEMANSMVTAAAESMICPGKLGA